MGSLTQDRLGRPVVAAAPVNNRPEHYMKVEACRVRQKKIDKVQKGMADLGLSSADLNDKANDAREKMQEETVRAFYYVCEKYPGRQAYAYLHDLAQLIVR